METTTAPAATITPITSVPTRDQRNRMINAASAGMIPAERKKRPDPLEPWWIQIRLKRRQGFSFQQITTMLNSPIIGLNVSQKALTRFVAAHENPPPVPRFAPMRVPVKPTTKTPA